jgi:NitT/TauT family transport system permease protein
MKRENSARARRIIISSLALIGFVLVWDGFAVVKGSPYLPRPTAVFETLLYMIVENQQDFSGYRISQHVLASLSRVFYGFIIAAALAVPTGLVSGWSFYVESATSPIVEVIRPIPPFAWIPFAIYFFRDPLSSVFIVFIGAIFPILLSTMSGVKSVDSILIDASRTLGAGRLQIFGKVVIPASAPSIMTGMRIGLGVGWMAVVAAELVGVKGGGLGIYILNMSEVGLFGNVFAGMILIGLLGFLMVSCLSYVERRFSRWAGR